MYELCMFHIPFLGPRGPLVPPLMDPSVRPCQKVWITGPLDVLLDHLGRPKRTPLLAPPDLLLRIPTPDGVTDGLDEVKAMSARTSHNPSGES